MSQRYALRGIRKIAMEAEAEGDKPVADAEVAQTEADDKSAQVELAKSAEEGNTQEDNQALAEDGVEELEATVESMECFMENGGMSRDAAVMLNRHLSYVGDQIGMNLTQRGVSLEGFQAAGTRLQSTGYAMEDLKSKIKEIWAWIVKQIKAFGQWIRDHWMAIFGAAEKLQKRAKALAAKAKDVTGDKEAKITDAGLLGKLYKSTGGAATVDDFDNIKKLVDASVSNWSATAKKNADLIGQIIDKCAAVPSTDTAATPADTPADTPAAAATPATESYRGRFRSMEAAEPKAESTGGNGGVEVPEVCKEQAAALVQSMAAFRTALGIGDKDKSEELPGNVCIAFKAAGTDGPMIGRKEAFDEKGKVVGDSLPTLDSAMMQAICAHIEDYAGRIAGYKTEASKVGDVVKGLEAKMEKMANRTDQPTGNGAVAEKYARKIGTQAIKLTSEPVTSIIKYAIEVGSAGLDYVQKSIAQYGKK